MYKITSDYIFEQKDPLTERFYIKTTKSIHKVLQDIAIDNEMSLTTLINNAILQFLINDIEKEDSPT